MRVQGAGWGAGGTRANLRAKMRAPLTTRCQPRPAPPVVALLLGALPTFIVLVGLLVFGSIWAAVFGVEMSWVLSPAVVCWAWPASRKAVADDWHAATRRLRQQALVGAAFWLATAASAILGFWLLGRHTGVRRRPCLPRLCQQAGVCTPDLPCCSALPAQIIPMVRSRAAEFGLSVAHPGAVAFFVLWFSLVNPVRTRPPHMPSSACAPGGYQQLFLSSSGAAPSPGHTPWPQPQTAHGPHAPLGARGGLLAALHHGAPAAAAQEGRAEARGAGGGGAGGGAGGGEGGEAACGRAGLDAARRRGGEARREHPDQRSREQQARLARVVGVVGVARRRRHRLRAVRCLPPLSPAALPTATLRHTRCARVTHTAPASPCASSFRALGPFLTGSAVLRAQASSSSSATAASSSTSRASWGWSPPSSRTRVATP